MTNKDFFEKLFTCGNDYWLTGFVILRLLGFAYAVAFLVAGQQLMLLTGEHGLTPAKDGRFRLDAVRLSGDDIRG
jgi:hypothetical protein